MAFILPNVVAREALMILSNELVATSLVNTTYASEWTGAKKGDTITIRKPAQFRIDEFTTTTNPQGVSETSTTLTLEKIFDATVEITAKEMTLELNDFSTQIVQPLMVDMAQKIDEYILSKYVETNEITGDGNLNAVADLAGVNQKLMELRLPMAARQGLLSPASTTKFLSIDNLTKLDTRGAEGLAALRDAQLGRAMMVDWYASQNVPRHIPGVPGGTPTGTASAGATTVTVAGGGNAGTFKQGDIVSFAGISGRTFVVTNNATLNGSGAGSITIFPALPSAISGANITVAAAHDVNLVGNWKALSFASVPLELPINNASQAASMNYNGISIRVVYDYNSSTKKNTISFDVLAGAKVTDPRLLSRFNAG